MRIQEFIRDYLKKRLEETICLVVYDPEERYKEIVLSLGEDKGCMVVDGSMSTILGRERALEIWQGLMKDEEEQQCLVVYLPIEKPISDLERQQNPYQIFAIGGGEFPRDDGDAYQALCRKAAPDLAAAIDDLFEPGVPNFDTVNNLIEGKSNWPKLRTILKAESAVVFNTSNTECEREKNVFGDPLETIWKNCIFGLCGVRKFHRKMFNIVVASSGEQREKWLEEVRQTVDEYFPPVKRN